MKHFLQSIPWQAIAAIVAVVLTAFIAFRFGRRWSKGYREALANRKEYHALKADAQLRASMQNEMTVNASPVINIGTGAVMQPDVHDERQQLHSLSDNWGFCPFCGRFDCRATCRKEVDGPANGSIRRLHAGDSITRPHHLASRVTASLHGPSHTRGLHEYSSEENPGLTLCSCGEPENSDACNANIHANDHDHRYDSWDEVF